jgi:alpha-mannosidase
MAKFESLAHKWVDLSEYGYGVSILNDSKYGHAVHENVMKLSLLRYSHHLKKGHQRHQYDIKLK